MNDLTQLQYLAGVCNRTAARMSDDDPTPAMMRQLADQLRQAARLAERIARTWTARERVEAGLAAE